MRTLTVSFIIYLFFVSQAISGTKSIQFEDFFSVSRVGTPVVSPDGKQIAFASNRKGNYDIYVISLPSEILALGGQQ